MTRSNGVWRRLPVQTRRERAAYDLADRQGRQRYLEEVRAGVEVTPGHAAGENARPSNWRRLAATVVVMSERISVDDLGTHAGALTYGAMLSIPPLLLFALSVTGFVLAGNTQAQDAVMDGIASLLPASLGTSTASFLHSQMSAAIAGRLSFGVVGIITLLWSASGLASRLRHAMGRIFGTARTGLLTGRFVGALMGLLVVGAILGIAVLSGATAFAGDLASHNLLVRIASELAIVAGEFVFFLVLYRVLTPGHGPRIRDHLVGATVFVLGWEALKGIGSIYFTSVVTKSSALYGAVGSLFGVIAFLYATAWILLLGAECAAYRWERRLLVSPTSVDHDR
jgi:membrane protein